MRVTQDRVACPFICTVQAPQSPTPQPNFEPVSPRMSRRYQSSDISGSPSNDCTVPFTFNWIIAGLECLAHKPKCVSNRLEHGQVMVCSQDAIPLDNSWWFHDHHLKASLARTIPKQVCVKWLISSRWSPRGLTA